jgi:TRAP-type mannitol/chloroaromatic compound transport system permease large subunit
MLTAASDLGVTGAAVLALACGKMKVKLIKQAIVIVKKAAFFNIVDLLFFPISSQLK